MKDQIIMFQGPEERSKYREGKWIYSIRIKPAGCDSWEEFETENQKRVELPEEFKGYSMSRVYNESVNLKAGYSRPIRYFKGWFIFGITDIIYNGNRIMKDLWKYWEEEKAMLIRWDKESTIGDECWTEYAMEEEECIKRAIERTDMTQAQINKAAEKVTDEKVRKTMGNFTFKEGTIPRLIVDRLKQGPAKFIDIQIFIDDSRAEKQWINNRSLSSLLAQLRVGGYIKQEKRGAIYELNKEIIWKN